MCFGVLARCSWPRINGDSRALVLIPVFVDLLGGETLAVVLRHRKVDLALEFAVLVEAIEGAVADVNPVVALVGCRAKHIHLDVGFVEEVTVVGVVARFEDRGALVLNGIAALVVVEAVVIDLCQTSSVRTARPLLRLALE